MPKVTFLPFLCFLAQPLNAHPHVFVDVGLGFVVTENYEVTHQTVTWVFDEFYTLYQLADLGVDLDGDGVLTEDEKATLAEINSQWVEGFDGNSYIWAGDAAIELSGPVEMTADLVDGNKLKLSFKRALATAQPASSGIISKAYDPSFYTYYDLTLGANVEGPSSCKAEIEKLEEDEDLSALKEELLNYDQYSTPEDPEVGAKFADKVILQCTNS